MDVKMTKTDDLTSNETTTNNVKKKSKKKNKSKNNNETNANQTTLDLIRSSTTMEELSQKLEDCLNIKKNGMVNGGLHYNTRTADVTTANCQNNDHHDADENNIDVNISANVVNKKCKLEKTNEVNHHGTDDNEIEETNCIINTKIDTNMANQISSNSKKIFKCDAYVLKEPFVFPKEDESKSGNDTTLKSTVKQLEQLDLKNISDNHKTNTTESCCKATALETVVVGDSVNPSISTCDTSTDSPLISYKEYESELQMPDIIRLIQKDLSEPYSIYTYRYFIHNWPKLCFLAMHEDLCVGAIVCKLGMHSQTVKRGYIAMLAVDKNYRKLKIGTNLVQKAIQAMLTDNADEVVLETEITNTPALRLYENLGFVRDKRLFHYYLNGVDALRLKLWFR